MADFGNIEVDGLVEQKQALESLLMTNPAMEKKVQGLIRKVLMEARRAVVAAAQHPSVMKTDPRQTYKAVKTAVYRQILGGSFSILNRKRAGAKNLYEPGRKLRPGQRGGNRVPRSQRTEDIMSYQGADRSWILRIINAGTSQREAGTRGGRIGGNRGSIAPRNFFATSSHTAMQQAAKELTKLIDELIQQELK